MKKITRTVVAILLAAIMAFSPLVTETIVHAEGENQNGGVGEVTFEILPELESIQGGKPDPIMDTEDLIGKLTQSQVGFFKSDQEFEKAWRNVAFQVYDKSGKLIATDKGSLGSESPSSRAEYCKYLGPFPNNQNYTIKVDPSTLPKNYHSYFTKIGTGFGPEDVLNVNEKKAFEATYSANGNNAIAATRFHMEVFSIIYAKNEEVAKNIYKLEKWKNGDSIVLKKNQDLVTGWNPDYKEGRDYFIKTINPDKSLSVLSGDELQILRKNSLALSPLGPIFHFNDKIFNLNSLKFLEGLDRSYCHILKRWDDNTGINTYNKTMTAHAFILYLNQVTAEGRDITVNVGDKPKAEDGIINKGDFPEGTTFKFKDEPDTSEPGTIKATVVITSPDGKETAEIEININVLSNVTPDKPRDNERIGGDDRIDTAGKISKEYYSYAENVVVARKDDFPDALTASVLAKALNAPILLTDSNKLDARVAAEIKRLGAKKAYVIGRETAISKATAQDIKAITGSVERIGGLDRYETSTLVANKVVSIVGNKGRAIISTGQDFADALSISSYAAKMGYPILLVKQNKVPMATGSAIKNLGINSVYITGGDMAVSTKLDSVLPKVIKRLAGSDRYETSAKIADEFFTNSKNAFIASGQVFADALVIGPVAANNNAPVLLTKSNSLPESIKNNIDRANYIRIVIVGLNNAISKEVEESLR